MANFLANFARGSARDLPEPATWTDPVARAVYDAHRTIAGRADAMTRDDLIAAGEALYGPRWQSEMARLLEIDDRRVRAWLAGERTIPDGIWIDLAVELRRRGNRAIALADQLSG